MFFGAAAISQGIEYCKRNVHTLGLRGEIGPAVTMARFVVAMARGERAIMSPVPITVAVDGGPAAAFDCEIVHVTTLRQLVLGLRPYWGTEAAPLHYASVRASPKHWIKALPGLLTRPAEPVCDSGQRLRKSQRPSTRHGARQLVFRRWRNLFPDARRAAHAHGGGADRSECVTLR